MTTATPVATPPLNRVREHVYEIPRDFRSDMRVPARVLADHELLAQMSRDRSFEQLVNVATLPGIVGTAIGMPDMHEGYGFPVGGVAATAGPDGVVSPGGIGFDINCGVRLLVSDLTRRDVGDRLEPLVHELSRSVPAGFGRGGRLQLTLEILDGLLAEGCPRLVREQAMGEAADLDFIESRGCLPGADPAAVSERAKHRGHGQLGTLGGGNHFLEVQVVDEVHDPAAAQALGLVADQVTVLLHTGSRGLGHQVCSDYVARMDAALPRHGITLPDRQLACAPLSSPEGAAYLAAMAAAANFGFCNRQVLTRRIREVFQRILGPSAGRLRVVYDVAHNTAKLESHGGRTVCVHRKGATRAFGPSAAELPEAYRSVGQPVFIPGTMGTASFVLVGTDASSEISFSTTCHGAGRAMSRTAARRTVTGGEVRRELESRGIVVRCPSRAELAEEAPFAYKDVEKVVNVVHALGIAKRVACMRPLGVIKG